MQEYEHVHKYVFYTVHSIFTTFMYSWSHTYKCVYIEQWLIRSHHCYCSYYYRHHPQHRFYSYDLQSDFSWSTAIQSAEWANQQTHTHTQEKKQNPAKQFKCTHRCQHKNTHTLSSGRPVVHCSLRLHPWRQSCTVSLPCPRTSMGQPIRLLPTAKDM